MRILARLFRIELHNSMTVWLTLRASFEVAGMQPLVRNRQHCRVAVLGEFCFEDRAPELAGVVCCALMKRCGSVLRLIDYFISHRLLWRVRK